MNLKRIAASLFFSFLYCSPAFSYEVIGEVVNLRGQVTQLRPGDKLARKIGLNEELLEDTSVLTGPKSMVMIRMRDRSTVTLGPKSKMVLVEVQKEDDPGVISLLNGRLRSEVQKIRKQKKRHKQLISTRSAAMGVRGTDFIVSHNGENNVTSLVTLKGEVEMAKIDESHIRQIEESFESRHLERIERFGDEDALEVRELKRSRLKSRGRLKVALNSKQVSKVGAGHHSGTVAKFNNISRPVRIAPEQFAALYQNRDFAEASSDKEILSSEDFVLPKNLRYAKTEGSPLGMNDPDKKIYAPKAGGFVDLESALYIPPSKQASFHENYNLFVSRVIGGIDPDSGDYRPPEGLGLDPVEGFVVNDDYASALAPDQRELLGQNSEKLNQQLASEFVVGEQKDSRIDPGQNLLSSRELMTKNILKASIQAYDQSALYSSGSSVYDFSSSVTSRVDLTLAHSSGRNWQLITGLSYKDVSYDTESLSQDNSGLFGLVLGARYYLSSRLNLVSQLGLEQDHYIETVDGEDTLSSVNSTRLSLGVEWEFIRSSKWRLNLDAHLHRLFSKKTRELETDGTFGLELKLNASYWLNRHNALEFGPRFYQVDQDQSNSGVLASFERDESGIVLSYKRVF